MASKTAYFSELAEHTAVDITATPKKWMAFLQTMARIYKYPYEDQILIYAQRPDATACATFDIWNKKMGRYIRRGASGIALIDNSRDYPAIKYVFDVSDTKEMELSRTPNIWEFKPEHEQIVRNALYQAYEVGGITLEDQLEETARFTIDDYWYAHKDEVSHILDESMLGDYDIDTVRMSFCEAATASAGYVLMRRFGLDTAARYQEVDFIQVCDFNTAASVSTLGRAVSDCAEAILRQAERSIKLYERQQQNERRQHNEQSYIQPERGLPDSQPGTEAAGTQASGRIRSDAQNISEGAQADPVVAPGTDGTAVSTSMGDRQASEPDAGHHDAQADAGSGSDRKPEEAGHAEVGRDHELPEGPGRGSDSGTTGLRIDQPVDTQVSFFPSEREQIEYLTQAEDAITAPSAFSFPQDIIDQVLRIGSNTESHRMAIAAEFSKTKGVEHNAEFIKRIYHGGNGLIYNGTTVCAWYQHDGIRLTGTHSARYARTFQLVSWEDAALRIDQLLNEGKFADRLELSEASGYERKKLAEALWYLSSDLSDSGREADLLPSCSYLHGGFPAETAILMGMLNDTASIAKLTEEMQTFLDAYQKDQGILRFHYHRPDKLLAGIQDLTSERTVYHSELRSVPDCPQFITEDEIDSSFMRGSGVANGKGRIYAYFLEDHTTKEQADFLSHEYGIGGRSHALSDNRGSEESHDGKGIVLKKAGCETVTLTWAKTAKRLSEMIRHERYLSMDEAKKFKAIRQAHEPDPEVTPEATDAEEIDGAAIRESLAAHGIVNGEVVDSNALDASPFIKQVMSDVHRIDEEEYSIPPSLLLAEDLDKLAYDYDTYDYKDRISDREEEVERLQTELDQGRTGAIFGFLTSILASPDADFARRAYNLLNRMLEMVPEPTPLFVSSPNPYSHGELDRVQIQTIESDGTAGEILGVCREEKAVTYISALNNSSVTAEAVRTELTAELGRWHCYIIPDLASWNSAVSTNSPRTPIEYFDAYQEAENRFRELRNEAYNQEPLINPQTGEAMARLTIGVQRENPPGAADLLHVRGNLNYLVDDFRRMSALNTSDEIRNILNTINRDLGLDRVRLYEKDSDGLYLPPQDIPFDRWENSFFDAVPDEQLLSINESLALHVQECDEGYDYSVYDLGSNSLVDGGILERPDLSIGSAVREICLIQDISDLHIEPLSLDKLDDLVTPSLENMGILEMVNHFLDQGMTEEQAYDLANSEWQARQAPSVDAPDYTQDEQSVVDEPEVSVSEEPEVESNHSMSDQEFAWKYLIPGETSFIWDDRKFVVESVDTFEDRVELTDITFQESVGFPISRIVHIREIRDYLENTSPQPDQQIVETSTQAALTENFRIIDPHFGEGGPKAKFNDNIRAIELLKQLELDGKQAAPDEQEVLSRYVGWGGLPEAFDSGKAAWNSEYKMLKDLLTPEEYESAKGSTLNSHYTSPVIIQAIYNGLEQMGFRSGTILEPSCGTGNFFGMLPGTMNSSRLYGVELDSISGRIAQQLYPQAHIDITGFEKTDRPNSFDIAVGNVPFGQYQLFDPKFNKYNLSIHNYFFLKSLDQVRPNGIVAFITSRYTMDASSSSARRYIAQQAELLGAIRLPNNAFKQNANTDVVADIIFLQKREHPLDIEPDWVQVTPNEKGYKVNTYFQQHPEMILGTETERTGPHGMEYTVAPGDTPLADLLAEAVGHVGGTYLETELNLDEPVQDSLPADPNVKNYSYAVLDGKLYYRENSTMSEPDIPAATAERIKGMVAVREVLNDLIYAELNDYPDEQIQTRQKTLNDVYDAFTQKHGLITSRANEKAFSDDPSYFLLSALEYVDEKGNLERKADVFTKRTIRANHPVEHADTANDALIASIGEKGRVDLEYMSRLMDGKEISEITDSLRGVIYCDPSLPEGQQWVTADEYLSGNVREKLQAAQLAAASDPSFQINVQSLTEAQPEPLDATEISVRLGATWVDPQYIEDFMHETFQTPYYRRYKTKVEYSAVTGEWKVSEKGVNWANDIMATSTYGTTRATAYQILEDSLNLRDVRVNDYIEVDGKRKTVLNQRETTLAAQKQQAIGDAFCDWIWRDADRRTTLVAKYNELFNSTRPRQYDGSHIVFANMNPEITLRPHQLNAVAHILYGHNVLLAHEVGAGKTYEMIAAAMEGKRLGQCNKSLFVVPNHLILQWSNEFLRLYPAANILVTKKSDFEPGNRKRFCAKITTGDYDAIIMAQSQFEMIPVSIERQRKTIEDQLQEIEEAIYDQRWSGKSFSVKQLEKAKKSLQARLEKLMATDRKDNVVTFEELGIDKLFVDESQSYKNLYFHTKMRNICGLSSAESQRSTDMLMKCRYLDEVTNSRGVVFASGTPISNSMAEMYTLMRYLQHDTLVKHGLTHFDSWAGVFGQTTTSIELAPEGTGYRARSRFARFYNLPELMCIFSEVADIKLSEQLHLPVPQVKSTTIAVKPTEEQKALIEGLSERASEIHAGNVDPSVDNMLKITSDGKKIGLDQRLINPMLPDDPDSKVNTCIRKVFEIWENTKAQGLTQLIFCDMSTPPDGTSKKDTGFNVYEDIKSKLVSMGVKPEEVAFIHSAKSEVQKKELFEKVRKGSVRILLGSTQRMGAGTNVQTKLIAVHHLDVPWRPSDMTQRNGRIVRQGNTNAEVQIYQYVTQSTFDSYLFQTLETKQRFISQIMTSRSPARSCDDVDESVLSYAEIKALSAGNPKIKEKMDLDIQVANLQTLKSSYKSEHYRLEDKLLGYFPKEIQTLKEHIAACEKDLALCPTVKGDTFPGITVNGVTYSEKKPGGQAIIDACRQSSQTEVRTVGCYRGFQLDISFNGFTRDYQAVLRGSAAHTAFLSNDPNGNIVRLDNAIEHIPERIEKSKALLSNLEEQQIAAQEELEKPFPREEELRTKSARLAELNIELDISANHPSSGEIPSSGNAPEVEEPVKAEKCAEHKKLPGFDIQEEIAMARQQAAAMRKERPTHGHRSDMER